MARRRVPVGSRVAPGPPRATVDFRSILRWRLHPSILAAPAPRPQAARPRDRGAVHGGDLVALRVAPPPPHAPRFDRCRMRRWLPRALWLLAWSFWAWLGWGLYRELPRSLTPFAVLPFPDEH